MELRDKLRNKLRRLAYEAKRHDRQDKPATGHATRRGRAAAKGEGPHKKDKKNAPALPPSCKGPCLLAEPAREPNSQRVTPLARHLCSFSTSLYPTKAQT